MGKETYMGKIKGILFDNVKFVVTLWDPGRNTYYTVGYLA